MAAVGFVQFSWTIIYYYYIRRNKTLTISKRIKNRCFLFCAVIRNVWKTINDIYHSDLFDVTVRIFRSKRINWFFFSFEIYTSPSFSGKDEKHIVYVIMRLVRSMNYPPVFYHLQKLLVRGFVCVCDFQKNERGSWLWTKSTGIGHVPDYEIRICHFAYESHVLVLRIRENPTAGQLINTRVVDGGHFVSGAHIGAEPDLGQGAAKGREIQLQPMRWKSEFRSILFPCFT